MVQKGFVVVTDRGGHLHNALMLLNQMDSKPATIVATEGPDLTSLQQSPDWANTEVLKIPTLFSWLGKIRFFNPIKLLSQLFSGAWLCLKIRPKVVISLGASNVVLFCYWARLFGAKVFHVECMNQVVSKSITGRMLYPICDKLFVQWEELVPKYGNKAEYAGWVL